MLTQGAGRLKGGIRRGGGVPRNPLDLLFRRRLQLLRFQAEYGAQAGCSSYSGGAVKSFARAQYQGGEGIVAIGPAGKCVENRLRARRSDLINRAAGRVASGGSPVEIPFVENQTSIGIDAVRAVAQEVI